MKERWFLDEDFLGEDVFVVGFKDFFGFRDVEERRVFYLKGIVELRKWVIYRIVGVFVEF